MLDNIFDFIALHTVSGFAKKKRFGLIAAEAFDK